MLRCVCSAAREALGRPRGGEERGHIVLPRAQLVTKELQGTDMFHHRSICWANSSLLINSVRADVYEVDNGAFSSSLAAAAAAVGRWWLTACVEQSAAGRLARRRGVHGAQSHEQPVYDWSWKRQEVSAQCWWVAAGHRGRFCTP